MNNKKSEVWGCPWKPEFYTLSGSWWWGWWLKLRTWDDESASLTDGRKDLSSEVGPEEGTELEQGGYTVSQRLPASAP